jgi:hypothetical protein
MKFVKHQIFHFKPVKKFSDHLHSQPLPEFIHTKTMICQTVVPFSIYFEMQHDIGPFHCEYGYGSYTL